MQATSTVKKFVVVAYDIVQNKPRNRLLKLLKGHGAHVQKSVFECLLTDEQIGILKHHIQMIIDAEVDTVRLYILHSQEVARICVLGQGEVYEEKQLVLV